MNVDHSLRLIEWVRDNEADIRGTDDTLAKIAARATTALNFKVSTGALRAALRHVGVPTRRGPKHERQLIAAQVELRKMEEFVQDLVFRRALAPEHLDRIRMLDENHPARKAIERIEGGRIGQAPVTDLPAAVA